MHAMRKIAPYGVRMPGELKQEAMESAKRHKWSLNTWVVEAIREKLEREKEKGKD